MEHDLECFRRQIIADSVLVFIYCPFAIKKFLPSNNVNSFQSGTYSSAKSLSEKKPIRDRVFKKSYKL